MKFYKMKKQMKMENKGNEKRKMYSFLNVSYVIDFPPNP